MHYAAERSGEVLMAGQPGFFDRGERYASGDPLQRLARVIDFELFRPELDAALARSDRARGGRPSAPQRTDPAPAHTRTVPHAGPAPPSPAPSQFFEVSTWRASGPIEWANESFAISVSPALQYCVRTDSGCWYAAGSERLDPGEPEKVVLIDRAYIETHTPTVKQRLVKAGVRLSGLLNQALGD
jgi:hypothetical protein